jgi:hypothetical protein
LSAVPSNISQIWPLLVFVIVVVTRGHVCRQYGTINLLSALTSEAVKSVLDNQSEEETWGADALDILLETWNAILVVLWILIFSYSINILSEYP